MNDLQAKLKQAEAKIEANDADIQSIVSNKLDNEAEVIRIKAEIEQAKKPPLRSGDIQIDSDGDMSMYLKQWSGAEVDCTIDNKGDLIYDYDYSSYEKDEPVLANITDILDDLKAMLEDVTEFENKGTTFRLNLANGKLAIITPRGCGYVDLTSVATPIRQMEATLKRQAK